ncbi:COP1-interacting protein 7-like [Vicia villosa]|uniref:COP1-interacting protein 7-like n=1 Tax=Vicia villosa TaxID=3911 RepID=UPI00273C1824|nr:COP1-interacting protein 7-like [Vicia villosa]
MDPSSCLDHALFQLTPTRTRCDLVIVAGGVSERLASGLLEPFLSHLKCAKDQISKGGYSITLHPVGTFAPWFTKATLQRFVRFVSTPEVLERFVTIEKEIVQIEGSVQSSEVEGNLSYVEGRVKRSTNSSNQDGHEENSRVRLQRVLDNRKAMLCKEQAMAYARALVAGYYPESMDDLICFADAFGASRLREACLNFLELCKQKNEDKLWMDEIAAMQVSSQPVLPYLRTSGIVLAGEDESTPSHASLDIGQDDTLPASGQTPSTDGRAQMPKSWPNHHPQYIHNFQGHPFQQMPPYQGGYVYPGMQVPPSSYFPGNMQWPPNEDRSHNDKTYKKKKKKKNKQSQVVEHSEEDKSTTSSESSYESDSDADSKQSKKNSSAERMHKKKHGKKSSRKVVIRNINYITSKGDGEKGSTTDGSLSNEEEFINGDSLKHKVEEAVASFEKRNKSNSRHHKKQHSAKHLGSVNDSTVSDSNGIKDGNNWDAFQNLLLIDDDDSKRDTEKQPMKFEEEYMMNKNFEDGGSKEFEGEAGFAKTRVVSDDSFVVTQRELNNEGRNRAEYFKEGKDEPTFMQKKNNTDEDLMFSRRNEESGRYYSTSSATDGLPIEKNKKDILADDSFMIEARSSQNKFNSQSAANISSVSDIIGTTEFTNGTQGSHKKTETLISREPDDLLMVLDRDSAVVQNATPWRMEMDYENNIALSEANRKPSDVGTDKIRVPNHEGADKKTSGTKNGKISSKDAKSKAPNASVGRSKSEIMTRSRTLPGSKTTVTKSKSEKEEETRKRREELMIQRQKRIAERSAKKTGTETKNSTKKGNPKIHPSNEETKKSNKPVIRSSTINRLATARVTQRKVSPSQPKPSPAKKPSLKANKVPLQQKKQLSKEVKSSNPREDVRKTKGKVLSDTNAKTKNEVKASPVLSIKPVAAQAVEQNNNNQDLKVIGEVSKASPEKHPRSLISEREIVHENMHHIRTNSSLPNHDHPSGGNQSRGEEVSDKLPSLHGDNMITASTAALPIKPLIYTASNSKVDQKIEESYVTPPKVSEIQISTPPPSNQAMQESNHNRKKWINDEEDSSKAAKGFRKLLFFGRRS